MRSFEKTHSFIKFGLDTRDFSHSLWMQLGEAASKVAHIAGVPLQPAKADELMRVYLTKGAAATTAIEGNTLSEDEVQRVLDGTSELPKSQQYLEVEIQNIANAYKILTDELSKDNCSRLTNDLIAKLNKAVLDDLELEPEVVPGEFRKHSVTAGRYLCAPAEDIEYLMDKFCRFFNDEFPVVEDHKNEFIIIKAALAHLYFVWIHPFGDGNGRTARLIEMFILLQAGMAQPIGHLLSNHYNKTRSEYYRRLDRARHSNKDVVAFIEYSVQGFVDGLKEQISFIRSQQWMVSWVNYIHECFDAINSEAATRQRHVVLALSQHDEYPKADIRVLSSRIASEYQGKSDRTVSRDVNKLREMGLVGQRGNLVRAKKEKILAFLPWNSHGTDGLI